LGEIPLQETLIRSEVVNSGDDATDLIRELARFHVIKAIDMDTECKKFSPSTKVDSAWHQLMLFPRLYSKLCTILCGTFIDHNPLGGDDKGRDKRLRALDSRYRECFGMPPPEEIWDEAEAVKAPRVSTVGDRTDDVSEASRKRKRIDSGRTMKNPVCRLSCSR
jgi:hypothetical protein